jgi:hypothetical protein
MRSGGGHCARHSGFQHADQARRHARVHAEIAAARGIDPERIQGAGKRRGAQNELLVFHARADPGAAQGRVARELVEFAQAEHEPAAELRVAVAERDFDGGTRIRGVVFRRIEPIDVTIRELDAGFVDFLPKIVGRARATCGGRTRARKLERDSCRVRVAKEPSIVDAHTDLPRAAVREQIEPIVKDAPIVVRARRDLVRARVAIVEVVGEGRAFGDVERDGHAQHVRWFERMRLFCAAREAQEHPPKNQPFYGKFSGIKVRRARHR